MKRAGPEKSRSVFIVIRASFQIGGVAGSRAELTPLGRKFSGKSA
jgi:hypothetical protein